MAFDFADNLTTTKPRLDVRGSRIRDFAQCIWRAPPIRFAASKGDMARVTTPLPTVVSKTDCGFISASPFAMFLA